MAILNLTIDQGTTFETDLTINQDATTPLDLTGYTFRSQMRRHYRSVAVTETLTVAIRTGVSRITLDAGGTLYTSAPAVTITPQGGDTPTIVATATATIDLTTGSVTGVVVDEPGVGYTNIPLIGFTGGGGSGATATAVLDVTDGKIKISLTDTQTSAIKDGRYVYDVESIAPTTSKIDRVIEGRILVTPEVTK